MRIFFAWLAVGCLFAPTAEAALIAADGYKIGPDPTAGEYAAGNVAVQPANVTTPGFNIGGYTSGTTTSQFSFVTGGLDAAGVSYESGDKMQYASASRDGVSRRRARNMPLPAASPTYYISHLVNRGGIPTIGGGYALTGFGNVISPDLATTNSLGGVFVGFAGSTTPDNFGNLVIRSRNTESTTAAQDTVLIDGAVTSTANTTYHVVIRLDVNVSGGQDQVTYWLNPADVTSETTMSATAAKTGTYSSFALQGPADFVRLNVAATNWDGNVYFDEPRLGTDLVSVVGAPIPEPAGLAAIGAAGAALLWRRRTMR